MPLCSMTLSSLTKAIVTDSGRIMLPAADLSKKSVVCVPLITCRATLLLPLYDLMIVYDGGVWNGRNMVAP